MLRASLVFLALAALVLPASEAREAAPAHVEGRWMGTYTAGGASRYMKLSFFRAGRRFDGDATDARGGRASLGRVAVRRNRVSFRLGRLRFSGTLRAGRLTGRVRASRGGGGPFAFVRLASLRRAALAAAVGTYRLASGRLVAVFESHPEHGVGFGGAGSGGLRLVDLESADARGLFPRPGGTFAIGPALNVGYPVLEDVRFEAATRLPIVRENVRFPSGGATIAGRLLVPQGPGRHPAVVIVHGSGPTVRSQDYLQHVAHLFAVHGLIVLTYDKRGSGQSTGAYPGDSPSEPTFRALSDDVLAGLGYLRSRADVNPARVGLWGLSQGGWVGSYAAARSADVAFAVLVSGGAASAGEEAIFSELTGDGRRIRRETEPEVARAIAAAGVEGWDPDPVLRSVRAPVLFIHGGNDTSLPPLTSHRRIERLREEGRDFTNVLLPGGDHELYESSGLNRDVPLSRGFLRAYFTTMVDWLRARGFAGRQMTPAHEESSNRSWATAGDARVEQRLRFLNRPSPGPRYSSPPSGSRTLRLLGAQQRARNQRLALALRQLLRRLFVDVRDFPKRPDRPDHERQPRE
jgi:dienelactone hydrolase